jgi:hypothetical protein
MIIARKSGDVSFAQHLNILLHLCLKHNMSSKFLLVCDTFWKILKLRNSSSVVVKKGKALVVTGREGPGGSETSGLSHFL